MVSLVGGFGRATSHIVAILVGGVEGVVVVGPAMLAMVSPLSCPGSGLGSSGKGLVQPTGYHLGFVVVDWSCPGSGLGSSGAGLAQPTGCLLGFGVVVWSVPMLMVVLMVW